MSFKDEVFNEYSVYVGDYECDQERVLEVDDFQRAYDVIIEKQKDACLQAIEPLLIKHFALSEMRDLYRRKIKDANIITEKEMLLYKELAELLMNERANRVTHPLCNGYPLKDEDEKRINELIRILGI